MFTPSDAGQSRLPRDSVDHGSSSSIAVVATVSAEEGNLLRRCHPYVGGPTRL